MRIALIGHYKSGNLGDEVQREVMENFLASKGAEVTVCGIDENTDAARVMTSSEIGGLRSFDAIVFGGCLAVQNNPSPIWFDEWFRSAEIPMLFCCIGAERPKQSVIGVHEEVLRRAKLVIWRDRHSANSYLECGGSVVGADLAYVFGDLPGEEQLCTNGQMIIMGGPDAEWLEMIPVLYDAQVEIGRVDRLKFIVLASEPRECSDYVSVDRLMEICPDIEIVRPTSPYEAIEEIRGSSVVISSRRHGVLFSRLAGVEPIVIGYHTRLCAVRDEINLDLAISRERAVLALEMLWSELERI